MERLHRTRLLTAVGMAMLSQWATAGVIAPELAQELATRTAAEPVAVIIQFADRVDARRFERKDRRLRDAALVLALRDRADRVQRLFRPLLDAYGPRGTKQLWLINAIAVTLPAGAIEPLARHPAVSRIQFDAPVPLGVTTTSAASSPGWNLEAIHAPAVWALGHTGNGVVVASMDTGVDPAHPDLAGKWRGGGNSWYDPYGQHGSPYDAHGHGTQTTGLMVGGATSGTAVGVAPGARWIAVKIFNDAGQGSISNIHLAFQWLMDPDGNPATFDAPDVVNASWSLLGVAPGSCNLEFEEDIRALKVAGTAVVFAGGNEGPAPGSSVSPANNANALSAGAVDSGLALLDASSRGPSGCDSSVYPSLVAPGVNVVTTDLSAGGMPMYASVSGTSFAAPHLSGALALLAGAFPAAPIEQLEAALTDSAQALGAPGADNDYGHGLGDALAAYNLLAAGGGGQQHAPAITSAPLTTATEGQTYRYQVAASDADGGSLSFRLDAGPLGMVIDAASGVASWTPTLAQVGTNAVGVRVTDASGLFATQEFAVAVARRNTAPVSVNDSYATTVGSTLVVGAPGVLANDSDANADRLSASLAVSASHGTVTLSADGSFRYVPVSGYAGTDSFSYRASDGQASGNTAIVSIKVAAAVNQAPVAADDAFAAPVRTKVAYTAQVLGVLANDTDADGTIDATKVTIVNAPDQGGSVTVKNNGTLAYTPKQRYTGTETFKYRVKDNKGLLSNVATVTVTVH
ncbi:MAG: hypothetical protein JWP41_1417 [Ramlibacter sp.]|nr:hypothetical protein [Ramlibacter sp.]